MMLRLILSHRLTNDTVERDDQTQDNTMVGDTQQSASSPRLGEKRVHDGDDNRDEDSRPTTKIARFELESNVTENDWALPESMSDYIWKYIKVKVSDKDIKSKILTESPVPTNIKGVPELDRFMKDTLLENNKSQTFHVEKLLKTLQEKEREIFGPLSKLWAEMENERDIENGDEEATSTFNYFSSLFEKTILLVSQTFHRIEYQRRLNILSGLIESSSQVTDLLKDHADILNCAENKFLFGEKFEEVLQKSSKTKKKSADIFTGLNRKSSATTSGNTKPFRSGPLPSKRFRGDGSGRGHFFTKFSKRGKSLQSFPQSRASSSFASRFSQNPSIGSKLICCKGVSSNFVLCGKDKIFPKKLAMSYPGSSGFRNGSGISDSVQLSSETTVSPSHKLQQGGNSVNRYRNFGDAPKGSNQGSSVEPGTNFKSDFHCSKEGLRFQTCNKSERSESKNSVLAFQNGGVVSSEGPSTTRGSDVQIGPKGCVFRSPSPPRFSEVCSISVGTKNLPIPLPMLWSSPSTKGLHKVDEDTYCSDEATKCSPIDILRRYPSNGILEGGVRTGKGHTDLSLAISRFSYKHKQVRVESITQNAIPRYGFRFSKDVGKSSSGESPQNKIPMPGDSRKNFDKSKGASIPSRAALLLNNSNTPCSTSVSLNTKKTYSRTSFEQQLRLLSGSKQGDESRTELVDSKVKCKQWPSIDSNVSSNDNINRCLHPGLGGILYGQTDRGTLDIHRKEITHKCSGAQSNSYCFDDICKDLSRSKGSTYPNRQYDSALVFGKNGGHKESCSNSIKQRAVGVHTGSGDHNYCRTPTRETKRRGGYTVENGERFKRMEAVTNSIQQTVSTEGCSINRSICLENLSPSPTVHVMEVRPIQSGERCFPDNVEASRSICISSFFANSSGITEGSIGTGLHNVNHASLANTGLVSKGTSNVCSKSYFDTKEKGPPTKSRPRSSSSGKESKSSTSCMENFRQKLSSDGLSEKAISLITGARRKSSISHYNSAWGKFSSWCIGKQADPFRCSLILILEFLTDSFDRGLQYNTLAGYRSAISAFHEPIDGVTVGKHPQVSALLTGIYNSRFPQPKYNFIWDVEKVVTYLQSLGSDSTLDDKTLTMKLTTLMALTSAARAHEICSLDIRFLVKHRTAYTFSFGKPTKTDKPGRKRSPLKFLPFEENKALCVCTCIENYLSRSSSWRDGRENQLLLSYVKPHIPVKSATVSRWLTCILKDSGIDVNIFSGHSTRSASTSKAKACGVPMKEILKRGHWSNITTFEKYYSKEIGSDETNFQKSILSGL